MAEAGRWKLSGRVRPVNALFSACPLPLLGTCYFSSVPPFFSTFCGTESGRDLSGIHVLGLTDPVCLSVCRERAQGVCLSFFRSIDFVISY